MVVLIAYNLLLAAIDAAALFTLSRRESPWAWPAITLLWAATALLSSVMGGHPFAIMRLAACGVFLHGLVWLVGSALVLRRRSPKTGIACILLTASLLAVAVDAFWIEPTWLEVSHIRLASEKIHRPVRIAVVADVQTDAFGEYEEGVFRRVLEEKPDLILLAGDYVQAGEPANERIASAMREYLREIGFAAPAGMFAVGGNLDPPSWPRIFFGLRANVITRTRTFDLGDVRLTCLEVGDSFDGDLEMRSPDRSKYHVVLGHSPNFAMGAIEADLLLAGHTHGGQVRLPLLGPLVHLSRVPRSWAAGLVDLPGGRRLIVSRGVGMERGAAPRLRFLCRPEIVIIDLEPESP